MNKRQVELVQFSEKIYHSGLRHKGINGSLYEDILIKFLREDLPDFGFFKGQIKNDEAISSQYDIIVCRKETIQPDFLEEVNKYINIVERKNCLAVIELKKWANPKMISKNGTIEDSYKLFKKSFPEIKYLFVALRFKDRKNNSERTWNKLKLQFDVDYSFCFFGRTDSKNEEWLFPWKQEVIDKYEAYFGEYEKLLKTIKNLN